MENREKQGMRAERRLNATKLALAAAALIAFFLLGYIPASMSARSSQERNSQLEYDLSLADLRGQIGMASYEANQNNYASAAQRSTGFFNGLREVIDHTSDQTLKQDLERILARRDEITANLAAANPAVKEKLAQAFVDLFQVTAARPSRQSSSS
jgi:hypothetical protein